MDNLDWSLLLPAFCAGLLVLLTHVALGQEVLRRGIIFLDLAIAQIAAVGALVTIALGHEPGDLSTQVSSFGAAITGALLLGECERRWPQVQEAIIGILFVLSATGALLLLAHNAHGSEELKDILAGQILWVSFEQLWKGALLYLLLLPVLFSTRIQHRLLFYVVFSLCVTLSVQWVGVYLVFSSLVIPALATRSLQGPQRWWTGFGIGVAGYGLGLVLSALFDLPSGPLIVWTLTGSALLFNAVRTVLPQAASAPEAALSKGH